MTTENAGVVYPVRSRCAHQYMTVHVALGRCPPVACNLSLKCVGTLITWPYTAGGCSRQGSRKIGTTVPSVLAS